MVKPTAINITLGLALCLGLSFAAGRYTSPTKVETREVVRVETKTVEVERKRAKVRTEKVTETKPDGSQKVVEVITDDSVTDRSKDTYEKKQVERVTITETKRANWQVSVLGTINHRRILTFGQPISQMYGLGVIGVGAHVQRRVLGPIYLGGYANTNGDLGVSLGASF